MIVSPRLLRRTLFILTFVAIASFTASAQDSMDAWKDYDFAKTAIKPTQLQSVPLEDLKLLRGLVFGRHGRVFKDAEIKTYLEGQSWFKSNPDFKNSSLNDIERQRSH